MTLAYSVAEHRLLALEAGPSVKNPGKSYVSLAVRRLGRKNPPDAMYQEITLLEKDEKGQPKVVSVESSNGLHEVSYPNGLKGYEVIEPKSGVTIIAARLEPRANIRELLGIVQNDQQLQANQAQVTALQNEQGRDYVVITTPVDGITHEQQLARGVDLFENRAQWPSRVNHIPGSTTEKMRKAYRDHKSRAYRLAKPEDRPNVNQFQRQPEELETRIIET